MKRIGLVLAACFAFACGPDVERDVSTPGDAASSSELTRWRVPQCTPRIARTQPLYCDKFYPNATTACTPTTSQDYDGSGWFCLMTACLEGYGNCDGIASNGCEAPLQTVSNCGACGTACPGDPNGSPQCQAGKCGVVCNASYVWDEVEEVCVPGSGGSCTTGGDCDDGIYCTVDTCVAGSCVHAPKVGCCDSDADCPSNQFCGGGWCKGKLPTGSYCSANSWCQSGVCSGTPARCL